MREASLLSLCLYFIIGGEEVRYEHSAIRFAEYLLYYLLPAAFIDMAKAYLFIRELPEPVINTVYRPSGLISMDKWALWMRKGSAVRGYPTGSKGFVFWGVNCFDDCEEEADSIASRAVDGTMRGLEMNERAALGVLWLGHSIVFRRLDVDVLAVEGLKKIHAGLILRGVA